MPLFDTRRRMRERAEAAQRGETRRLTTTFPKEARVKLAAAMQRFFPATNSEDTVWRQEITPQRIRQEMHRQLVDEWGRSPIRNDYLQHLQEGADDDIPAIIEAWFPAVESLVLWFERQDSPSASIDPEIVLGRARDYQSRVNEILELHDVAYRLVGVELVPRDSEELWAGVVDPVLALGTGDARFQAAEQAYWKALQEMKPGGDPGDAITDAARALQEALLAVGCAGNALGDLVKDARKRELLAGYDAKLNDAVIALGDWVNADRTAQGDAHLERPTDRADAWLAIHVAGALIVRLAAGGKRVR